MGKIRELNDEFRKELNPRKGKLVFSYLVSQMPPDAQLALCRQVRGFEDFNRDNDPHGEHDFGAFDWAGDKYFWKIDYYDKALQYGSEDPSDPEQTTRVLTLMRASEY